MNIFNIEIENYTYDDILYRIRDSIEKKNKLSFTYVNAFVAISASKNDSLRKDLSKISTLYIDGIGIYLALKTLNKPLFVKKRINATDLNYRILDLALKSSYKIFFFGGGDEAHKKLQTKLSQTHPLLRIAGSIKRSNYDNAEVINSVNSSNPDILFVGLGTPEQEKWISENFEKINAPIVVGVGSWIEFATGVYPRAPLIMRKFGFEWLFRLILEPSRLWRRYLIGIPVFGFFIIKEYFNKKDNPNEKCVS